MSEAPIVDMTLVSEQSINAVDLSPNLEQAEADDFQGRVDAAQQALDLQHSKGELRNDILPNWLDSLPYPKIWMPYGTGGDANAGETLTNNWYRWIGEYDKVAQSLKLTAAPTEYTKTEGEFTYDTRFAKVEPDGNISLITDNQLGYRAQSTEGNKVFSYANTFNRPGYDYLPTEHDGRALMFRGINEAAMKKYLQEGSISAGEKIFEVGQIFFAPEPNEPFGYASNRNQFDMASFDHPAYMISVEQPEMVEPREDKAIVLTKPMPVENIVHVYEIRPAVIKTGLIPSVTPDDKSKYMALPPVNITSFVGPAGAFMYKEISLDELKKVNGLSSERQ